MNFERLSKKAVSYSSASMTKNSESVSLAETEKSTGTPPIKNPGLRPATSRIRANIEEVVVFPCVPATASTHFGRRT